MTTMNTSHTSLTTSDALAVIKEAFPFEIDKFPLSGPEAMRTPFYGLFRDDNGDCVGNAVTARYTPHTTDDVLALAEAAIIATKGLSEAAFVSATFRDGHYVTVKPGKDQMRAQWSARYGKGSSHNIRRDSDIIVPELIIRAGYDGRAFTGTLALRRLVCNNLLTVPVASGIVRASLRHTNSLRGRMDDLIADFAGILNQWDAVTEVAKEATQRRVDMADFITRIYGEPKDTARSQGMHEKRVRLIMTRLWRERRELGISGDFGMAEASAWDAFNAVQGYEQHDANRNGRPSWALRELIALDAAPVKKATALAFA